MTTTDDPQPIRGRLGATILGPRNVPLERENPNLLSSPGTDSLGRSGVDGFVDTHFWERFGAGLLLSVIDDAFQIASAKAQNGNAGSLARKADLA